METANTKYVVVQILQEIVANDVMMVEKHEDLIIKAVKADGQLASMAAHVLVALACIDKVHVHYYTKMYILSLDKYSSSFINGAMVLIFIEKDKALPSSSEKLFITFLNSRINIYRPRRRNM